MMSFAIRKAFFLLFLTLTVTSRKTPKSITTLINAQWPSTPIVLEIAEFIADEDPDTFWAYVDLISNLSDPLNKLPSEQAQYDTSLKIASKLLTPGQLSALKLALALRSYSPKMEMFAQMGKQRGVVCSTSVDLAGRLYCSAEELPDVVEDARLETFRVDHHYPGSANRSVTAILYGELGTEEFAKFHRVLKEKAIQGKIDYVLRAFAQESTRKNQKVRLSGYAVELQMKSTEYKVMDDSEVQRNATVDGEIEDPDEEIQGVNFYRLHQLYPDLKTSLDAFRTHLLETGAEMAPLKVWQVQDLSLQAAERILQSESEQSLKVLIHICHNFPLMARSLILTKVRDELKSEIKRHQETFRNQLNLHPHEAALFINGMYFDVDILDVFTLLETLRQELRVMEGLHRVGITPAERSSLLALDFSSTPGSEYGINIRDSAVIWVNDVENDKKYKKWPSSLLELLRPTFPGMMRSIRRNLFNLVLVVDPADPASRPLLKLAESFYVHTAPVRIGLVFALPTDSKFNGLNDASLALLIAVNYISESKDPFSALSFVTEVFSIVGEKAPILPETVHKKLKSKFPSIDLDEIFGLDSAYETGRGLSTDFIARSGLRSWPQALLNGIPLNEKLLNAEEFEEAVLVEIMRQTPLLQTAVFRGDLADSDSVIDYLMSRPNILPRLNNRILSSSTTYLDFSGSVLGKVIADDSQPKDIAATLIDRLKYFSKKADEKKKKPVMTTHWIVADLETIQGRSLLRSALQQMTNADSVRVGIILNFEENSVPAQITQITLAALHTLPSDIASQYILRLLDNEQVLEGMSGLSKPPVFNIEGLDVAKLHEHLITFDFTEIYQLHGQFVRSVIKFKPGERGVITNGRVFGPFAPDEAFISDDFSLLDAFFYSNYGEKVLEAFKKVKKTEGVDNTFHLTSDMLLKTLAILIARPSSKTRMTLPVSAAQAPLSSFSLPPRDPLQPAFHVVAILDPVSRGAQKLAPLLDVLYRALNMDVIIHFNCVDKHSDLPLKNFYRFVLEPELSFTNHGELSPGPYAKFSNLPTDVLFTQAMLVPENWLVESVSSPHDLDNIKLDDILQTNIQSVFELEHLLVEGHCFEANAGNPPRGLQITLGTEQQLVMYDTIVMANLGYFQLKASPGAWILRLREGRSSDLYNIVSHDGSDTPENSTDIKVIISSFRSNVLKLRVQKKPDKIHLDLLSDDKDQGSGIWNSITSSFSGKQDDDQQENVINIFSLASGHLYERFLKIMMLSVLKHTKTPVKFWFLKNYLSPTLKDFLDPMSKEYNFQYELVQYKWPRWLHQQTEKQRIIWGYKILFLDVLFPLDVKKIIFVDADQVVRADMKELRDLDLSGAPYGYTPFCESRTEMDGFRFWKQGYWRNHLQGRKYHISALYVVDLKRFRRIAAGDRLRGQYQALSQDPNSLSNLDQDLPNNMIHQVAIKSLPQEWLWCETWCDDQSKPKAKTIDLCNNPMTKEAKLTAAMRIIPEWKDYDNEIKELQRQIDSNRHLDEEQEESITTEHPKHMEL